MMKLVLLFLSCAISTTVEAQSARPRLTEKQRDSLSVAGLSIKPSEIPQSDAWLHAGSSASIQFMGYTGLRAVRVSRKSALVASVSVTVLMGLGKELYDRRSGGAFSIRDLAWDLAGAGAGILLARAGNP